MTDQLKPAIDLRTVNWREMGSGDLNWVIHQVLGWTRHDDNYVYKDVPDDIPDDGLWDWWCKAVDANLDLAHSEHETTRVTNRQEKAP